MNKKGQTAVVTGAISIIVLVVMALIVSQVVTDNSGNFTGLSGTILTYFVPLMLLGGLIVAAMIGVSALKKRR